MAGIKGKQLENAPDGITPGKLNDLAVTTAKIDDLAVVAGKLGALAVTTAKLDNLGVTTGKIAAGAVITLKIGAGALSADASGRALMAAGYFDSSTVSAKFASGAIALDRLAEALIQADGGQAFTADQSMGGFKLTGLGAPTAAGDAATKNYVDAAIQGLDVKESCRLATAVALPANTAAGSKIGKTLTADANGALTVDGIAIGLNDRLLVKNEATGADNGIYTQTQVGTGGLPYILTRATDADEDVEVDSGLFSFIEEGTANANSGWVLTTADPITVDTTAQVYAQFSAAGVATEGPGIDITAQKVSLDLATDPGLEMDAGGDAGKVRVLVAPNNGLERVTAGIGVLLDGDSLARGASGLKSVVPTLSDKELTPAVTSGDGSSTTLTITATPGGDGYVGVRVNGLAYVVGDASKVKDCYFSGDAGTTARGIPAIVATDVLFWNGVVAGFDLAASDIVDIVYES